ncbi:MAG: 30S ribosomal protein S6 [Deltaproteobacteria bacterium]|nr:30S ribosomal protein S6 [Deltaproteobacteria bacterium]
MRRYETVFITPPELPEEAQADLLAKINSLMATLKGEVIKLEDWGIKKLSYEIRKNIRGHYYLLDYTAAPDSIRELERILRLNDRILKYQTVKISDQLSPEALKALKEAAAEQKVVKAAEPPPSAEPEKVEKVENAKNELKAEVSGGDAK